MLLSCSHCFHPQCLATFECFSAREERCCPLCRCKAYHTRRIHDAELAWRNACATAIQAAFRGMQARRHCSALRRLLPPRDPVLRRRWCVQHAQEGVALLVDSVDRDAGDIDKLFAELDAAAAAAGEAYSQLAARTIRRHPSSGRLDGAGGDAPRGGAAAADAAPMAAMGTEARAAPASPCLEQQQQQQQGQGQQPPPLPLPCLELPPQQPEWEAVVRRCLERDELPECAICLAPLGAAAGDGVGLLSCSHAFHSDCLSAFEAFAVASELAPSCPTCRSSAYQRLDL